MRIAVVSTPVFPVSDPSGTSGYAGLEVIAYHCARGLAAKGHKVKLITPDGSTCYGVEVVPIGPAGRISEEMAWGGFSEMQHDGKVLRQAHPGYWQQLLDVDVVIDHSWQKYSYLLKAEGRIKCPVLGVLHAPVNTMYQSLPPVEKPCMVCISDDQRAHFEGLFGRPARTCHNGIDLDFYRPLDTPRTDRFLFLARFSSIKGPDIAIAAAKKLGIGLDLIGDQSITNEPAYLEQCKAMAAEAPMVNLVGPCSRAESVWWFSRAHCMLHPNQRFREPLGLAPLESQAAGAPVIAWNFGAMRETVVDGETGQLVNSVDEFEDAVRKWSEPISDQIRKRCRENASRFSIPRMVSRYEELAVEATEGGGW